MFDHVQRMPMAFFTRAQTGALTSRLSNDVMGAQRAVTGTLGSVVSNVVTLVVNGAAIILLEWRFAVLTMLLLPVFIVPAKRVGRHLQELTRQPIDRKSVVWGTSVAVRVDLGGRRIIKKKKKEK